MQPFTLAVGLSALAGTFAVTQTAALGQHPSQPSSAQLAARTAQADAAQAELDGIRALRVPPPGRSRRRASRVAASVLGFGGSSR